MEEERRPRRPYTITKQRESWSDQEHSRFVHAINLFQRDWKKISAHVRSKTVLQIKSHAQKYFQKIKKNSSGEYIPPPRPKRKLTVNTYPENFPNNALVSGHSYASTSSENEYNEDVAFEFCQENQDHISNDKLDFQQIYGFLGDLFDPCSSDDNLKKFKELDPIDKQTVLLLMWNLYSNLTSPDCKFEQELIVAFTNCSLQDL